jgi:hypothetical protein
MSKIRTAVTREVTVWLNAETDLVRAVTTVAELEAYLAELRRHGAVDDDKVTAGKTELNARFTATLPLREDAEATP